jgi:L-amino acid N-acyltransferase YncA
MVREEGVRPLVFGVLAETVYRRLVVLERALDEPAGEPPPGLRLEVGELREEDLDEYEEIRPGHRGKAVGRLAAGQRCFAARIDGELAGVRWVATRAPHLEYLDLVLPLAAGEVLSHDGFTAPAFRRRGVSALVQATVHELLRAEGHRRVLRVVLPENRAGLADAARAGFRARGRVGYVRLGPWRLELHAGSLRERARWFAVRALGRTVYRRLALTERRLDVPIPLREATVPVEFSFLEPREADAYASLRTELQPEQVRQRLTRGERCWTARRDGRIVSARWVVTNADAVEIPYLGHRLELDRDQAYVYETFTAADQRGCGISGAAGSRLARLLAAEGYRTMLGAVWPDETAIVRANAKAGYEPVGTLHSFGRGRLRRTFLRR